MSDNLQPNSTIIDIPDDEALPDIVPYSEITENYEEFGAENYVSITANMSGDKLIIINEQLYLLSGTSMYVYNDASDSWTPKNPTGAVNVPLNAVIYNNLYGVTKNNTSTLPTVYKYSSDDNVWTSYSTFNFFGTLQAMECVNNRMYIFTGSSDYSDRLVEYVPPISPWIEKKNSNTGLANAGTAYINGKIKSWFNILSMLVSSFC
ncbi:MAG: hypothetical protein FWD71_04135 [Oscillospiraceae bacterium]|nr:hypothetical protein [Oscillospiraceae bacterium]